MKPERCAYCGDMVDIPFECTYCKDPFCDEHRLPEDHRCVKLTVIRAKKSIISTEPGWDMLFFYSNL